MSFRQDKSALCRWKQKNKNNRRYAHFDEKINLSKAWDYIKNPVKIAQHSFYPFIHYIIRQKKYGIKNGSDVKKKEQDEKKRYIYYSAHLDRYIFSYCGHLLNQHYNRRLKSDGIDNVAIAYRDNKVNMSNIQYARKAYDYIKELGDCFVLIGDFKSFFDELDHSYLKERLLDWLGTKRLEDDYFAVFKNITRFSYWQLESILKLNEIKVSMKNPESVKMAYDVLNKCDRVFSAVDFRKYRHDKIAGIKNVTRNNKFYGIPQGSAISGVLSNIYMLEFDKMVNEFVKEVGGLYMRYSDDFIVVLPKQDEDILELQYRKILDIKDSVERLTLEPKKTQIFICCERKIERRCPINISHVIKENSRIDYLGFSFDGHKITIRGKTISKYYYRMNRKLKTILDSNGKTHKGNRISAKVLYAKYTFKGSRSRKGRDEKRKPKGNFISYVNRARYEFGPDEDIDIATKNHMLKIKRKLKLSKAKDSK